MRLLVLTLGMLSLASPASAQWSAAVFLGNAATSPVRLTIASPDASLVIEPVELRDESSSSPWYYGGRVTRTFARARWLGVEAEFIHAKAISDASQLVRVEGRLHDVAIDGQRPLGSVLPRFELSHGLNFVLANIAVFWPLHSARPDPPIVLVARFGAGPTVPHVEAVFDGQSEHIYQLGGAAVGGTVGAQIRLLSRVAAVIEFKATRTAQHVDVGTARLEGLFATRHAIVGVAWSITS